uniref:Uncharacterized protein n=1 Tax=Romanomermis culicivorax TaxID=13658 RepID=A0A915JF06_ROMCU
MPFKRPRFRANNFAALKPCLNPRVAFAETTTAVPFLPFQNEWSITIQRSFTFHDHNGDIPSAQNAFSQLRVSSADLSKFPMLLFNRIEQCLISLDKLNGDSIRNVSSSSNTNPQ